MPEQMRQMTEANERIATLEAKAVNFEKIADKWDQMLVLVTQINSNLTNFSTQFTTYQKTCETERAAHANRLATVENVASDTATTLAKVVESLEKLTERVEDAEDKLSTGKTVWWTIFKMAAVVGGLAAFAVSVVTLWVTLWPHH